MTVHPATKKKPKKRRHLRKLRWGRILVLAGCLVAAWFLCRTVYLFFSPIELKARTVNIEYKEKYNPLDNVKAVFLGSRDDVTIDGKVDVNVEGDYPVTYKYKDHTKDAVIHVEDTKGPELKVKNLKTDMTAELTPESFVEEIKDASEYELSFKDDTDINSSGRHRITIVATDKAGNTTEKTAKLQRVEDRTAPKIEGTREAREVKQGTEFALKDLTITDELDPEPAMSFDPATIDMTKPGTYDVAITATDRAGNTRDYTQQVTVVENPEYGNNVVYLTFDDGPSKNTGKILDILEKNDAKATFFVTGNGQADNDMIKQAYDQGNTIGLHTYTHDYATVYASTDAYFNDLKQISDMVEDITGEKSKVIRFPGGSSNTVSTEYSKGIMSELVNLVHQKGYEYFDWNVSSGDASGNDIPVDQIVAGATACEEQYCTILFHDTMAKNTTVEALPKIIQYYKDKGYLFLPLHEDSPAAHHGVNN